MAAQSKSVTAVLRAKDSGFTSTFKKANSLFGELSGSQAKATNSGRGFLGGVKSIVTGLGLYKIAASGVRTVMNNLNGAMNRADTMTNYNRNMTRITGSAKETTNQLNQLNAGAKGTAYSLATIASTQMSFANSNVPLKKSTQYTMDWMDAVSAYGDGTNATYERVMLQLNQMSSKGKANLGDLKSAMEAGIPVTQMLAAQMGKSTQEISDDISAGKISAEQFMDAMSLAFNNGAGNFKAITGEAKKAGETWRGTIDNAKSAVTRGTLAIIDGFDMMAKSITGLGIKTIIANIGRTSELWMGKAGAAIAKVGEKAVPYLNMLKAAFNEVKEPVVSAVQAVVSNVGFMNKGFSETSALRGFSSVVEFVSQKIIQFSGFIERNSEVIGKLIDKTPELLTAFMMLKGISSVTQTFALFGQTLTGNVLQSLEKLSVANQLVVGTFINPLKQTLTSGLSTAFSGLTPIVDTFSRNFNYSMSTLLQYDDKGAFLNFTRSVGESLSSLMPGFDSFRANLRASKSRLDQFGGSGVGNWFRSFAASIELSDTKLAKFGQVVMHPVRGLKNLAAQLAMTSAAAGGSGTVISGAAVAVGNGFKAMSSAGIAGIKSLTSAMLTNPITAILVGITAGVAVFAMAWRNNFMNVQGATKSVFSGLKNTFSSTISSLGKLGTAVLGPAAKFVTLENAVKVAAVVLGTALTPLMLLIDGFRAMVMTVTGVINVLKLGALHVEKFFSAGKKRKELSNDIKELEKDIKNTYKGLSDDSATKALWTGMAKVGQQAEETGGQVVKSFQISSQAMSDSANTFTSKMNEMSSNFSQAFTGEGSSEGMKKYVANSLDILKKFNDQKLSISQKYSELMQQAEQAEGDERVSLQNQANQLILSDTNNNNTSMLSLYKELSNQLINGKTAEGAELTAEQRVALRNQTNAIREGLAEQNALFVQASMQKLQMQGQLSEQERQAAESNLKALYTNQKDQITANESEIKDLRQQWNEAKTQSEKDNLQASIDTLKMSNESMIQEQKSYADQQLALMLNGNEMTAEAVAKGLSTREDITGEGLSNIFASFVNSNTSIEEQLALLGGIMENKGFEGSSKLGAALKSGNLTALGGELTAEMQAGIMALPDSMFAIGTGGQQMFITALKNGDFAGAGNQIIDSVDSSLAKGTPQAGKKGSETGDQYTKELSNKKGDAQKSGDSVAKGATEGMKKEQPKQKEAGKGAGDNYKTGLEGQRGAVQTAGTSLGSAGVVGVTSTLGQYQSSGTMLAEGVASGIRSGTSSAVSAMADLVGQVNAEAKKVAKIKSPSRLLAVAGNFMGQGVGVGVEESIKFAQLKARNFVLAVNSVFENDLLSTYDFTDSQGVITVKSDIKQSTTNPLLEEVRRLREYIEAMKMELYLDYGVLVGAIDSGMGSNIDRDKRRRLK